MRRRVSYFWALYADHSIPLADDLADGLEYAIRLAEDAKLRAEHVREHLPLYPPLTIDEIAQTSHVSPSTVRRRIARARKALFGDLSDSGIYYRLRRQRELRQQPARGCDEPGCDNELPRGCSAGRRYCNTHRAAKARVARHRRAKAAPL